MRGTTLGLGGAAVAGAASGLYVLVVRGALTLDLGVGRRTRALGPQTVDIAAPRDVVFEVIAAPYRRTPRAMREKLEVLERAEDMVLAAHHTAVGHGLTTTTVETVRFEPPERVSFRLVRGPVPHVTETFDLAETAEGTELLYTGELGTDGWGLGARWGALVARSWEETVATSLAAISDEAERRAGAR
ncbi:MAG: SRPBCC family protein [Actinomycetota bacterium]|nr:SRPBCC family protein [Actinomycetota bacterium]